VKIYTYVLGLIALTAVHAEDPKGYPDPDPTFIAKTSSIIEQFEAAPVAAKRKVLVYGISFGPHRTTIPTARKVFSLLGEKTGAYEAVVSEDLAHFEADRLAQFDAVIFANTTGEVFCRPADKAAFKALEPDERLKQEANAARLAKNLEAFVRAGGGFMGIHAATDTLKKQPVYTEMIGATFWQHPWGGRETVMLQVENPGHALAKGIFDAAAFTFNDEIYEFRDTFARQRVHVILSLDLSKSDDPNRALRRTDGDYPVAWVRRHGAGRVFYCSLGHARDTYANPAILKFWLRGIQFATGDIEAVCQEE
jgi:uncharacterized protein